MKTLNRPAKLLFYSARRRRGDLSLVAYLTNYSLSHISNILAGRRRIPHNVASMFYDICCDRVKNSKLVSSNSI